MYIDEVSHNLRRKFWFVR